MFKNAVLFAILFCLSTFVKAQSLSSKTLLNNLEPFWVLLEDLREDLEKLTHKEYTSSLEQSYHFIQLELRDSAQQLFLQIKYQIQFPKKIARYSFYCQDKNIPDQFEVHSNQMIGAFEWDSIPKDTFKLSTKQTQHLEIADRIAALGNDLGATPSDYESVIITSTFIKLKQSNSKNSKSLDHKDSYFLRDLYFIVPLNESINKKEHSLIKAYYIGDMKVFFYDGSAKSQKITGDKIKAQLENEIKRY